MVRKLFILILFFIPAFAFGQRLQIENTYGREVRRLAVDTLFSVPADTFSVPAAYNTYPFIARKANSLYVYNTTTHFWQLVTAASTGWLLTGNAGTVDGTNFIGTTDAVPLTIRVNNLKSGYISHSVHNTGFGYETLKAVTTGEENLAFGWGALKNITTGNWNVGIGSSALTALSGSAYQNVAIGGQVMAAASGICRNNVVIGTAAGLALNASTDNAIVGDYSSWKQTTGSYTTAIGSQTLYNTTTGSNNIAVGYAAGYYNTTGSNQIFINSIERGNYLGDTTASPIWVLQNATVASQRIKLNGLVDMPNLPSGKKLKQVYWDSDGRLYQGDSTGSFGSGGITALSAIGTSPNANGATITGNTLNLEPADATRGGVLNATTQQIVGLKMFVSGMHSQSKGSFLIGGQNQGSYWVAGSAPTAESPLYFISSPGTITEGFNFYGTLFNRSYATEAASGVHSMVANAAFLPMDLSNGTATTTNAATVYIGGSTIGTASVTNNYAMWIDSGKVRIDELIVKGAATDTVAYLSDIRAYGGGGYTQLSQFVEETAWRSFYSNASGDVTPLAFGSSGTVLTSNGASAAPSWQTPAANSWNGIYSIASEIPNTTYTMVNTTNMSVFTGSGTGTWTLPLVSANLGRALVVKNATAYNLTVQRGGSDQIYDNGLVNSVVIAAGESRQFFCYSYWYSLADGKPSGAGYTNLTQFVDQSNWKIFSSDGSGDVKEISVGAANTVLVGNGATAAPSFSAIDTTYITDFHTKVKGTISGTSPIVFNSTTGAISINNADANGSTKGAASFTANDFNASSGNISIDYANGQKASGSQDGFLSTADWSAFNGKTLQNVTDAGNVTTTKIQSDDVFIAKSGNSYHHLYFNADKDGKIKNTGYVSMIEASVANGTTDFYQSVSGTAGDSPGWPGIAFSYDYDGKIKFPLLPSFTATDTATYKALVIDGSGNVRKLSFWSAVGGGGGTPAGSNTEVQYNNSGSFGASANLKWSSPALTIGVAGSTSGQLKLTGLTSGTITLQGQNTAGTWTFYLPADDGTSGQVLTTDGAGVTSWTAKTAAKSGSGITMASDTVNWVGQLSQNADIDAGNTYRVKIENISNNPSGISTGTLTSAATWHIDGSWGLRSVLVDNTNHTVGTGDAIITVKTDGGARTVTLPDAANYRDRIITVRFYSDASTNNITVDTDNDCCVVQQPDDWTVATNSYVMTNSTGYYTSVTWQSDGTRWVVLWSNKLY